MAPYGANQLWLFLNTGRGGLGTPAVIPLQGEIQAVTAGDFTSDGIQDIAAAGSVEHYVCVLRGRGDGTFAPPVELPSMGQGPAWIDAADLDGDGDLDLVVCNYRSDDLAVYFNDGAGRFDRCRRVPLRSWWARLTKPPRP